MSEIHALDVSVSNKIAAGEVVERPVNAVKELVENAVDAGATRIRIDIADGGLTLIRVTDNGKGILPDDLPLAIQRFATSKIRNIEDVFSIASYGFRGEALAAISSVSEFSILSRREGSDPAELIAPQDGEPAVRPGQWVDGTIVTVRRLFENVPARKKFLKTIPTLTREISRFVRQFSLLTPGVELLLTVDGAEAFRVLASQTMRERAMAVFQEKQIVTAENSYGVMTVRVAAGLPVVQKARKDSIVIGINGRLVRDASLTQAVVQAYHRMMPQGTYPVCAVDLRIDPADVDANVHPAKLEVKLASSREAFAFVMDAVADAIRKGGEPAEQKSFAPYTPQSAKDALFPVSGGKPAEGFTPVHHAPKAPVAFGTDADTVQYISQTAPVRVQEAGAVYAVDLTESMETVSAHEDGQFLPVEGAAAYASGRRKVVGQLFDTVIVCEADGEVIFIDQHVAHERVLYDRYSATGSINRPTVVLHTPILLELDESEVAAVMENLPSIGAFGYQLEPFGDTTLKVTQVPADSMKRGVEREVRDLVHELADMRKSRSADYARVVLSCKNAVKAGEKLALPEMQQIVDDLFQTSNPYTCPHGRPIIFTMTQDALFRKFQR